MKISSQKEILKGLRIDKIDEQDLYQRNQILRKHSFSIVIEAEHLELDSLNEWIRINFPPNSFNWLYYGKLGYNYGIAEYFGLKENQINELTKVIPKIFTIYPNSNPPNKTLRSIGIYEDEIYNPQNKEAIIIKLKAK